MNLFRHWPAALLSLAAFGAAATAQEPIRSVEPTAKTATGPDTREDVEILRRLLDQALLKAYGLPDGKADGVHSYGPIRNYPLIGQAQLSTDGTRLLVVNGDHAVPDIEGVYLKDYGAVYTATLPSPTFDPVAGSKAAVGGKAPLSPWDRTRKELHGEMPEPEGKAVLAHQPLSEVILKVLAENGRRFTALADGERITVAVTFRGAVNCANCHQNMRGNDPKLLATFTDTTGSVAAPPPPQPSYVPADPSIPRGQYTQPAAADTELGVRYTAAVATGAPTPGWLNDVRNQILLGDLHMKQGKGQEAVSAYKAAMDQLDKGMFAKKGPNNYEFVAGDLPFVLMAVDISHKTAQAYVAAGDNEAAHKELENASRLTREAEKLTVGAATTANPKPAGSAALPNKLVVTASKKLLDDVGAGKLTFEAFCKAATVEYTGDSGDNAPQAGAASHP